jgi:hypothetical protein
MSEYNFSLGDETLDSFAGGGDNNRPKKGHAYVAIITGIEKKVSKAGKDMILLNLASDEVEIGKYDNILLMPSSEHFTKSLGRLAYNVAKSNGVTDEQLAKSSSVDLNKMVGNKVGIYYDVNQHNPNFLKVAYTVQVGEIDGINSRAKLNGEHEAWLASRTPVQQAPTHSPATHGSAAFDDSDLPF